MSGIQEMQLRNHDLAEVQAIKRPHSKIGFVGKALLSKQLRILGPCAAQSIDQALELVEHIEQAQSSDVLKDMVIVVRLCPFKPRSLEITADGTTAWKGIGLHEGKRILETIKREHPGVRIFAEIMDPDHLQALAKVLDGVWIGNREGRSTIAKVTKVAAKHHIPVFIKNSSISGEHGVKDLQERVVTALAAAAIQNTQGKIVGIETLISVILRGTPAPAHDPVHRNISNLDWIHPLLAWDPHLLITMDVGHLAKHDKELGSHDPQAIALVQQSVINAVVSGVNAVMGETAGTEKSKTDPGIPIELMIQSLILAQHQK